MTSLIIAIVLALSISALCSTMEAMLCSIPWTTLEKMKESGSRSGRILYHMRSNVDQPISAILTLNTIANTAGASLAGALAAAAFGAESMPCFAALFTVLVLLYGGLAGVISLEDVMERCRVGKSWMKATWPPIFGRWREAAGQRPPLPSKPDITKNSKQEQFLLA